MTAVVMYPPLEDVTISTPGMVVIYKGMELGSVRQEWKYPIYYILLG